MPPHAKRRGPERRCSRQGIPEIGTPHRIASQFAFARPSARSTCDVNYVVHGDQLLALPATFRRRWVRYGDVRAWAVVFREEGISTFAPKCRS
jgi:hypothetical protein